MREQRIALKEAEAQSKASKKEEKKAATKEKQKVPCISVIIENCAENSHVESYFGHYASIPVSKINGIDFEEVNFRLKTLIKYY